MRVRVRAWGTGLVAHRLIDQQKIMPIRQVNNSIHLDRSANTSNLQFVLNIDPVRIRGRDVSKHLLSLFIYKTNIHI